MTYVGQRPANKPVTSADIEDGVVGVADLGANSVDSSELIDGSVDLSHLSATGTKSSSTYLRGDNSFATVSAGTSLSGSTNNNVATVTGANALIGEANLNFSDGKNLGVGTASPNSFSGYSTVTIGGSNSTTGSGLDFENNSGTILARLFGDASGAQYGTASGLSHRFEVDGTQVMKIDGNGIVTKPKQPAFIVTPTSDSSSHTLIDMATATHTAKWGTEILDANADFASNTFTAPVDGAYQMNVNVGIGGLDTATTLLEIRVHTSNVMYRTIQNNLANDFNADTNEHQVFNGSVLVYMDANDTCTVTIGLTGGGGQMDVLTGGGTQPSTCWSGFLVG